MCGRDAWSPVFEYTEAPPGEVRYAFSSRGEYRRTVSSCDGCGHMVSRHQMDEGSLYSGDYVNSTYGDDEGVRRTFERIINFDPARSDNVGRVRRIGEFAAKYRLSDGGASPTVLDVGSGLCVFLHGMKGAGWSGTALDPDPRAAAHARDYVGVAAVCADFRTATDLERYDLITFNKVLEHVPDPVTMLSQCLPFINPGGHVYVELPDGEVASLHGADREEFFIDHHHVFSMASLALLAVRAGFRVIEIERLQEPSTKYTLRAFLQPALVKE
ncbi:MAG: Methyltransferase type 11 [Armatimonadetes bacterium]|jgi:2-polyprenyl-3-methyl-5-hydroxy-6-metoxy-1,4-benzoquinol methylase|nr:Methyltransferase type 11 [Armatimonadota bacterium]